MAFPIQTHPIYGKVQRTGEVGGNANFVRVKLIQHQGLPCGGGVLIYVNQKFLK